MASDDVRIVNKTSRSKGAVGNNPICYQYLQKIPQDSTYPLVILDYGSGPDAKHCWKLRDLGFVVDAYEIGANKREGIHILYPRVNSYDIVVLSNVINIAPSYGMLSHILREVLSFVKPNGRIIFNYPSSPRKLGLSCNDMIASITCMSGGYCPKKLGDKLWEIRKS